MLPGKKYTLKDVTGALRRRKWLLIVPPITTVFLALFYSTTVPDTYEADVLVAIVPQRVPDAFVRSTVTQKAEDRLDAITTQVLSRTSLERIIREFNLYEGMLKLLPMEDVVTLMRQNVILERVERRTPVGIETNAFHVKFRYGSPEVAARVTQRLGSIYIDQNLQDRGSLAAATGNFLDEQLAEARAHLEAQERRLKTFRERHGNELPTQALANMQASQQTQMQIQAVVEAAARDRDRKLLLERLYDDAANERVVTAPAATTAAPNAADTAPATGSAEQQLAVSRAQLRALEMRYTSEHPDIVRAHRQIADLEVRAAAEAAQRAQSATSGQPAAVAAVSVEDGQRLERLRNWRAEIESLGRQIAFKESEEQRLRATVAEYQRRSEAVPGVESEWSVLSRDYDTSQASYKDLLNKSQNARVAEDLERRQIGEQFRVLDPAKVPVRPVSPIRWQFTAVGLAIGLLLGFGVGAAREFLDSSFRSESDILDTLALPVLASLPLVETTAEHSIRIRRLRMVSAAVLVIVAGAGYVAWTMRLWTYLV